MTGIDDEVRFWEQWIDSRGGEWPDDFRQRLDPEAEVEEYLPLSVGAEALPRLRILDVGSGPLTKLGKRYRGETNTQLMVLLDASASMAFGSGRVNKLDYARFVAASLVYLAHQQRDAAGLIVFDEEVENYVAPSSRQGPMLGWSRPLLAPC